MKGDVVKKRVDITGDVCPMTFVRVKMVMESLSPGDAVEVLLRREDVTSVMGSVKTEGYGVLSAKEEGEYFLLVLEK